MSDTVSTTGKIAWWKTAIVIVGFPIVYMMYGSSELAHGLFRQGDRDFYIPFWGGIVVLHWLSVLAVALVLKASGRTFSDIGYKLSRKGTWMLVVIFLLVSLLALGITETVLSSADINAGSIGRLPGLIPITFPQRVFFVLLVFSTGFCEEIVYRGFAITGLSDAGVNRWLGLFVAAFLFVGIHGVTAYSNRFLFLFGGGVMFGVLFLVTKNLLPSTIVHLIINLSAMLAILQVLE